MLRNKVPELPRNLLEATIEKKKNIEQRKSHQIVMELCLVFVLFPYVFYSLLNRQRQVVTLQNYDTQFTNNIDMHQLASMNSQMFLRGISCVQSIIRQNS